MNKSSRYTVKPKSLFLNSDVIKFKLIIERNNFLSPYKGVLSRSDVDLLNSDGVFEIESFVANSSNKYVLTFRKMANNKNREENNVVFSKISEGIFFISINDVLGESAEKHRISYVSY